MQSHQLPHSPDAGGSVQPDEEYLIGQDVGPRGLSAIPLDLDNVIGRLSAKRGNGLPGCAGTGTCADEILEKTGYHGIYPIPGHGGAEVLQQPRGGEQQRPYGPEGPVAMIWPKGGQTDTGLDPWGRTRSTRSTEYCAGVNTCCTSPPCDDEEPYRTHLRDDDAGSRPQDQCACIYHEDEKHPTEYRKPEIFCAGVSTSDLGVGYVGSSLVPQDARRENWTYDTRRNWTGHEVKSYQSAATPQWDLRQRGDYTRSMEYSASDQPTQESITRWTASGTVSSTYAIFHDRRGNLLDDGRQVFEYDALNRLTGVWESAGGGQSESEYEPGTKGHPVASFTYDGYGHRLTARYNVNDNAIIDDDPVDVYAYDRLWRVRTVTRATPSSSSAEATWTWQVREKWYYHDTESGQEMMTGPASTDAPIMRLIDTNGDGDFDDAGEEQHFVNDHQGSTVLVTGKATLDATTDDLVARAPIIAHIKYDQYGTPKFVHPADVNSDGVVDASDVTFWKQTWNEYKAGNTSSTPPSAIWKGTVDCDESGTVDESSDGVDPTRPSATNADWVAFQALHLAGVAQGEGYIEEQLGNLPLYAGYWWDDAIGLYHVRHRVYRPEWGRWLQRDPLGYAPGWNLYQYVNGMPWSAVDPMGLDAHGVGNLFRSMGLNWIGDVTDDFVDGAEVVRDTIKGNPAAATRGAVKGVLVGAAAGYLITEGIAATGPAAPYVGTAVFATGSIYAIYQVNQLGKNWNNLSEEEQAERLGEFGGGLFGGMIGYKVAKPTRAMPPRNVGQTANETPSNVAETCPAPTEATSLKIGQFTQRQTPWGREVYTREDIDWGYVRADGRTNARAVRDGAAPRRIGANGLEEDVTLHHANQDPDGTLIEVWRSTHQKIKHNVPNPSWRVLYPRKSSAYDIERGNYWRWRPLD